VVILSARTAQRFFGVTNPLGRRLRSPEAAQGAAAEFEVVGVVGDVLREGLAARDLPLQIYRPMAQRPTTFGSLIVHTTVRAESLTNSIEKAIWRVDPDQAIGTVNLVSRLVSGSVSEPRLYAALFGLFAGLAMLLAVIGVYGVVAHSIAQRTREFGVRSALGARPGDILALVLRQGMVLFAVGAALGFLGCLGVVRFLQAFVFGVSLYDPVVILAVAGVLVLAAMAACLVPARRAARLDPASALRSE
jgi:putative ABC transport system permease protein